LGYAARADGRGCIEPPLIALHGKSLRDIVVAASTRAVRQLSGHDDRSGGRSDQKRRKEAHCHGKPHRARLDETRIHSNGDPGGMSTPASGSSLVSVSQVIHQWHVGRKPALITVRPTRGNLTPLAAAQVPALAVIGKQKSLHHGPRMANRFRQQFPAARIELVNAANHIITVDQPEIVDRSFADFL
jgi:hypothetical protein